MTAPVPSDIDGPAGEAGDLIERLKRSARMHAREWSTGVKPEEFIEWEAASALAAQPEVLVGTFTLIRRLPPVPHALLMLCSCSPHATLALSSCCSHAVLMLPAFFSLFLRLAT